MHAQWFSHVPWLWDPMTVVTRLFLSLEFSRQDHWSEGLFLSFQCISRSSDWTPVSGDPAAGSIPLSTPGGPTSEMWKPSPKDINWLVLKLTASKLQNLDPNQANLISRSIPLTTRFSTAHTHTQNRVKWYNIIKANTLATFPLCFMQFGVKIQSNNASEQLEFSKSRKDWMVAKWNW